MIEAPEWPQLTALRIPEIKEEIENITKNIYWERLKPRLTAFSGKNNVLEMQFLGDIWNELENHDKTIILNHYQDKLQERFGNWIKEVRESNTGISI